MACHAKRYLDLTPVHMHTIAADVRDGTAVAIDAGSNEIIFALVARTGFAGSPDE